jgi:F-type H+-transporting ATPase subunit delta
MTETSDERVKRYADALFEVARAERHLGEVEDELFRFARVIEGNDELRGALTDPHIPAARRQQIVEDLLGGKATDLTTALVSLVVGTGRAAELPAIIDLLVERSASVGDKAVATVRSAIELSDDQRERLAIALKASTGKDIDVKVIIDPSVLGGIVTQIGETVIDGSIRYKLSQLREKI